MRHNQHPAPAGPVPRRIWTLCLAFLLGFAQPQVAQDQPSLTRPEWEAGTLYKILPYIEWPDEGDTLVIGLLKSDPFNGLLHQLVTAQPLKGRSLSVRIITEPAEAARCQVLFVPEEAIPTWKEWLDNPDLNGLLTVSNQPGFATDLKGVVNLSFESRKLDINRKHAKDAGLKISTKLLKFANLVKS